MLFSRITSFAVNQNDVKCAFQGPQDKPVTSPRLRSTGYPKIEIFPGGGGGGLPGLHPLPGDDPVPSHVSLEGFVVTITRISFIFLTFITADILRMRFNDLLTKASLWDRYVVYLII